jgi:aminomethyltransferase
VVLYPDGGIVDDCIVYKRGPERLQIVINAANIDKDVAWFRQHVNDVPGCHFEDQSARTGLVAVQGPKAKTLLDRLARGDEAARPSQMRPFTFADLTLLDGVPATAARTGYTGEDGFEIFCAAADAPKIWDALLSEGQDLGVLPCGLGARDTLRLEACLSLYGNDIDATTTPYEAGLGWVVKLDHDFIGRAALERQQAEGLRRRLSAFVMEGRGTARHGYDLYAAAPGTGERGEKLGAVTSGSIGPTVGKNIGMGYLPLGSAEPGTRVLVDCRGKDVPAQVVKAPFYKRPATS